MPSLGIITAVAAGGALGSAARYLTLMSFKPVLGKFPFETVAVNFAGCFAMGMLIELMALKWHVSPEVRAFLTVGFLGGYTTFSSFALDVGTLVQRSEIVQAFAYTLLSVALSLAGFFTAMYTFRFFFKA